VQSLLITPHPSCDRLLPCDRPVAMDSQYQHHGRLHQRSVILFLNGEELQEPRKREYHSRRLERVKSMKAYIVDTLWTTMTKKISFLTSLSLEQQYKSHHIDMSIQYVTEVVASDVSTSHHQSIRVPSWAQRTMHRVPAVPQLLDTIFSTLGHTLNPDSSLVFPPWSEVAPNVLW